MCWNATVSLNTYIVALFGSIFALANGIPLNLVAWIHCFSFMQLCEYFIWTYPQFNTLASWFGISILLLEPIASIFLLKEKRIRYGFLFAYILFLILSAAIYGIGKPSTSVAKNGHLIWNWFPNITNEKTVLFIWLLFFIIPLLISKYYLLAVIILGAFVVSIISFWKYRTWGTMWCWLANFAWLFIIGAIALDKCNIISVL